METAWAGEADMLVMANLADFLHDEDEVITEGRIYRLHRGDRMMLLAHPFEAIAWLREQA